MSEDLQARVRKSVHQVDRSQKWQIGGLALVVIFYLLHALAFIGMIHGESAKASFITPRTVAMGIFSGMLLVIVCALAITIYVSRMTKRILEAIEVSSRT